jgi:hypothetical protein
VKVEKEKSTALNGFYESIEVMFPIAFVKKKKKKKFWAYLQQWLGKGGRQRLMEGNV